MWVGVGDALVAFKKDEFDVLGLMPSSAEVAKGIGCKEDVVLAVGAILKVPTHEAVDYTFDCAFSASQGWDDSPRRSSILRRMHQA